MKSASREGDAGIGGTKKASCTSASSADIRIAGSMSSMRSARSSTNGSSQVQSILAMGFGAESGKHSLSKSGSSRASGHRVSLGVPLPRTTLLNWSMSLQPRKSGRRSSSSASTQPVLHTSTGGPYFFAPYSSSGARYHLVATVGVMLASSSKMVTSPKSASFITPSMVSSRLPGLTSRCSSRCECRCSKALSTPKVMALMTSSGGTSTARSMILDTSTGAYSSTRFSVPGPGTTSRSLMTFSCSHCRSPITSRNAPFGRSLPPPRERTEIDLDATKRPSKRSRKSHTSPNAPRPSSLTRA
mmetsp:Transcript_2412/g.10236  ORF Transcript_2412/g.10236 Transcript_2412/m.10236 type:complete len:301 (-) Transcript_2412:103-1005(-)